MTPLETVYTPWVAGLRWNDPASQQTKTGCQSRHPYSPLSTGSTTPQSSQNTWNLFWIPGKILKRNHTLTLHLSRNKYRIEYLFVSAAATNLQYNCFALKFTFYVLWLKRNAHTHFVFSNNSKRTYICFASPVHRRLVLDLGFFGHAIDDREESYEVFLILAASTLACGWKGLNFDANVVLMYFFRVLNIIFCNQYKPAC